MSGIRSPAGNSNHSPAAVASAHDERRNLAEPSNMEQANSGPGRNECRICCAEEANVVLLPCGHVFCEMCALHAKEGTESCHFCRAKPEATHRIYI
mmetsp:Transcript_4073/g.8328  ORF Transcript_4073/g.8328 Transcript_4073/m.8328 type:complete len:96 (+) Transcript_4073:1-288(+)